MSRARKQSVPLRTMSLSFLTDIAQEDTEKVGDKCHADAWC